MPLETATYISDLTSTNPAVTDGIVQGDDHLRLLKTVIKATFPNITNAVTSTHTVLNGLDGRVTTVESGKLATTGGTLSGGLTISAGGLTVSAGGLVVTAGTVTLPATSETIQGLAESATQAEVNTGTDDVRQVTPLKLTNWTPTLTAVTLDSSADYFLITDGSDSNKLKKAYASTAAAVIADQKSSGTAGGTFTSGAWQTRDLNTEISDASSIVTIASNQFTLVAGTYMITATAPAYQVAEHQARIYNVTDAVVVTVGMSQRNSGSGQTTTNSIAASIVTIAASKAFKIEHRCSNSSASNGFGVAGGWGTEQYTTVEIIKLA